jgi:hypothetical protein
LLLAPFPEGFSSFKAPSTDDLFKTEAPDTKSNILDKSSIQEILDSVSPYFSEIKESVESRLSKQTNEMTVRIDMLKSVLTDRETKKRNVASVSKTKSAKVKK